MYVEAMSVKRIKSKAAQKKKQILMKRRDLGWNHSFITSQRGIGVALHSGFAPSDRPFWTNFVGEKFRQRAFFLVRATEKIKTVLEPQKTPN